MNDKCFVDTNVAIYSLDTRSAKNPRATHLLNTHPVLSTQVVMESVNVLIKKFRFSKHDAFEHAKFLIYNSTVVSVTSEIILTASEISERYNYSHWDSLIIAAALSADCDVLYSEDLKDGQNIG